MFAGRELVFSGARSWVYLQNLHSCLTAVEILLKKKIRAVAEEKTFVAIIERAQNILPLPHRLEFVGQVGGVSYYNDSKATTFQAVENAVLSFREPIHLLMGGRNKGTDFRPLLPLFNRRNIRLYCFGEYGRQVAADLLREESFIFPKLEDAFHAAVKAAVAGDIVLLSPGCTSWDAFANFEERGNFFRALVERLEQEEKR